MERYQEECPGMNIQSDSCQERRFQRALRTVFKMKWSNLQPATGMAVTLAVFFFSGTGWSQSGKPVDSGGLEVGGKPVAVVLVQLGARLEDGVGSRQLQAYARQFDFGDNNRDGKHSASEYIEKGNYLTPMARRGIFRASDEDQDGFVSRDEYILNRIITDEAKAIVQKMDANRDGQINSEEFVPPAMKDDKLAKKVFQAMDTNQDGRILTPEYLRVWGQWARANRGDAKSRLARRRKELDSPSPSSRLLENDPNGDGMLDTQEWQQLFQRADKNGDRLLQKSELDAFFKEDSGSSRGELKRQ